MPQNPAPFRDLLAAGSTDELLGELLRLPVDSRRAIAGKLVKQAQLISGAPSGASWTNHWVPSQADATAAPADPAWKGRLAQRHWDCASLVSLASRSPEHAARYYPLPHRTVALQAIPALFPGDLHVFCGQWSEDYWKNPKNWDRNLNRDIMFDWVEQGLVEAPAHDGAVLFLISWTSVGDHGRTFLRWLGDHPRVTATIFNRVFDTNGRKGASLAQRDETLSFDNYRFDRFVIPGLIDLGIWSEDFVAQGISRALARDISAYEKRWFRSLARQLELDIRWP